MYLKTFALSLALGCAVNASFAQSTPAKSDGMGLSFIPDYRFKGSVLTGWKTVGGAKWTARNGEVSASSATDGGLLLMDQSFQDVGVHILFKCAANSEAGVLVRLEKVAGGMKGILLSAKDGEFGYYRVSIDQQGKITQREKLRTAGGIIRLAPPPPPPGDNANANRSFPNRPVATDVPFKRPDPAFRPGQWNQLELYMDANMVRGFFNDGGSPGSALETDDVNFGNLALYAAGAGDIQFKDIFVKDIALKTLPLEQSSSRFRVQRISDMYYSWGCTAGDFNKDGHLDIVAGPNIYFGPDFTKWREMSLSLAYNPSKDFTENNCQYSFDFNNDGWPDVLSGPSRGTLYINPKGAPRRWDKFVVIPSVQSEITAFKDLDNDGRPELIYGSDGAMRFAKPDPTDVTKPWIVFDISEKGYMMPHGIGAGDINGDGRIDIVNPNGWWEQPAAGITSGLWKYHSAALARYGHRGSGIGGSTMGVFDVNGDGLNDVVTSLNAHGFGLGWFEQKRDVSGTISFVQHIISDDYSTNNAGGVTISQVHGNAFGDIDGDGIPDLIVGKRYWSHLESYLDPDPYGAPVVYYYRTVRNPKAPGGAEFIPELIHNRSGAGSDMFVIDLNKDKKTDIITSNDRGTFIFFNKSK